MLNRERALWMSSLRVIGLIGIGAFVLGAIMTFYFWLLSSVLHIDPIIVMLTTMVVVLVGYSALNRWANILEER